MKGISTDNLFDELRKRFFENEKARSDLLVMTRKLEELNEKLRQAESHKSNFLSNIRRELNNPLAVIMDVSSELGRGLQGAEAVARASRTIYHEAFELDFQLKNILIAAEIEAGESTITISRIDVVQLIKNLVDSFKQKIDAKKLTVESTFEPVGQDEKLDFQTDASKLACILANLLDNAIKFNNEGEKVLVFVEKNDGLLRVSVSDSGIGIAEKDRKKIFERFVQNDAGTNKHHKGHGLGLSIAKALAEMLEGKVVFSRPSGKGCVFTLTVNEAESGGRENALPDGKDASLFDDAQKY